MPITALALGRIKPRETDYKVSDGEGLYLLVRANGSKLWRFNYRYDGKQKTLALGAYPDVGLADARDAKTAARKKLVADIDPGAEKRAAKVARRISAENTFDAVADAYMAMREESGVHPKTLGKDRFYLKQARIGFGRLPINEVAPSDVLAALRRYEKTGSPAQPMRSTISRVFRFAIASSLADRDPSAHLNDALVKREASNYPSPKEPAKIGELVRAVAGYEGVTVRLAALLGLHTFVRPGELRAAEWTEFDIPGAMWRIPAGKMKMPRDHLVPLSRQSLALVAEIKTITGNGRYLFPSERTTARCMSDGTVNAALRRMGFSSDYVVSHGFRSMASTTLNESGLFAADWIERQLAHVEKSKVRSAYNAAEYLDHRIPMMQWWSDFLDEWAVKVTKNGT